MLWLAVAAAGGVLLDHGLKLTILAWAIASALAFIACNVVRPGRRAFLIAVMIVPLLAMRHSAQRGEYESASIASLVGDDAQPVIVEAVIDQAAELRPHPMAGIGYRRDQSPWQTEFECRVERIQIGGNFVPATGRIVVVVDGACDEHLPGERVQLFGSIRPPTPPTNPGERDLRDSYRQRGLHARLSLTGNDKIKVIEPAPPSPLAWIADLARTSREILLRQTATSTGGLAVALVIGQREFVDPATQDLLLVTGTAHLLSVSGLHLAIVVLLARWIGMGLRLPRPLQLLQITMVSVFYVMITGGRPPVIRASILVGLLVLSTITRRPSQPINTLSMAAVILLAWRPMLIFNVGAQLSFLAVATLMLCGNRSGDGWSSLQDASAEEERLRELAESASSAWVRAGRWFGHYLRQAFWYSACVTAISMPMVWYQFHVVSPISVLTNLCMSLPLVIALAAGIATVIVGSISETLAVIPGIVCDASLTVMLSIIRFFASIPLGHAWLPAPPPWWVMVFYIVLAITMMVPGRGRVRWFRYSWITGWMVGAWFIATEPAAMDSGDSAATKIEATFVDVGHGTAVVMRFAADDVWLYDCGRLGNSVAGTADVDAVLWSLGVTRLTGVMLSHADTDHYNALPAVLRRFHVKHIYTPVTLFADQDPMLQSLKAQIDSLSIPIVHWREGETLVSSGVGLRVMHPPAQRVRGSDNANSLVLVIEAGSTPLVLPGDLEPPGTESLLVQPRPRGGGVMMAPHHGSLRLEMRPILDWSRAAAVVVSGGDRAARDEVHQALGVTGARVLVTSSAGAIRVRITEDGKTELRSWLDSRW